MSAKFPCPNPACTASFASESLQGASALTCPRCGTVFRFRADPAGPRSGTRPAAPASGTRPASPAPRSGVRPPAPTAPPAAGPSSSARRVAPPAPPAAAREPDVPVITLVPVQPPPAPAPEPAAAPLAFDSPLVVLRTPRRRKRWLSRVLILLAVTTGVVALGAAGFLYLGPPQDSQEETNRANELNYALPHPGRAWKDDDSAKMKMQVNRVFRRAKPAGAFALLVRDYKTRLPGGAELTDEALSKLRNCFPRRLEWEPKAGGDDRLGGQPSHTLTFEAAGDEDVDVSGEATMVAYRGFAYWLFFWGPASERGALAPEWDHIRGSFLLGNRREGWREKPRESFPAALPESGVTLSFAKGIWEEDDPGNYDPKAVKAFKGAYPGDPLTGRPPDRHAGKVAVVQLLALPRAPDLRAAATAARTYLLASQKDPARGNYPKTNLEPVKDKAGVPQDRDHTVHGLRAHVTKFRMVNDEGRERLVTLAALNQPSGVVAVWAECDWSVRDFWEQEFAAVVESLRPLKGEPPAAPAPKKPGDRKSDGEKPEPGAEAEKDPAP